MKVISIAQQFSPTPGGRTDDDGPNNGQRFRERFLEHPAQTREPVTVDLDGVAGLPGSFCDAAFGEIIRRHKMTRKDFDGIFSFSGNEEDFAVNKGMIDLNVDRAIKSIKI